MSRISTTNEANRTPPDAIVVLGCRVHSDGRLSDAAARRATHAADAWRRFAPSVVIASGGRLWHGNSEADALSDALVRSGVPRRIIVRELYSLSTMENAFYVAELLKAAGVTRPSIVTCEWHMARALECFERVGVSAVALPARSSLGPVSSVRGAAMESARRWLDRTLAPYWGDP